MKSSHFAILSIILSLLLHLALYRLSASVTMDRLLPPTAESIAEEQPQNIHLNLQPPEEAKDANKPTAIAELSAIEAELPGLPDMSIGAHTPAVENSLPEPEKLAQVESLLKNAKLYDVPVDEYTISGIKSAMPQLKAPEPPREEIKITAPAPELVAIDAKELPQERLDLPGRHLIPDIPRELVPSEVMLPSLAENGPLADEYRPGELHNLQLVAKRPRFGLPDASQGGAGMPMPKLPELNLPTVTPEAPVLPQPKNIGDKAMPLPFDDMVTVLVTVYRDPAGNGGCFQVQILPNPRSDSLQDIPKDVLFVVDRSSSISLRKFQEFKGAVREAMATFSPNDRFNIVSFASTPQPLYTDYVAATNANRNRALAAVNRWMHGGTTDVFGGLEPFVKKSNGNLSRPLNIFLLTDGKSTVNIYQPNDFLRQIVNRNPGNVSIFPCSAGDDSNRQLLDFLGYLNRGEKCHVQEVEQLRPRMVDFIARHSSMVIMDISCQALAGVPANEIYPRRLPHLYRKESLKLFGRFDDISAEIVLKVSGKDASGRSRDLIFRKRLVDCPQDNPTLPKTWAAQKIFYLLSLKNSTNDANLIRRIDRQVDELKKRYNIYGTY